MRAASLRPRFGAQVGMGIEPMGQKVKAWQIALFVAAAAVLGFSVWRGLSGPARPESTRREILADVTTGELFEFSTERRAVLIPERNPDTGKIALFPVERTKDGRWVVARRYLDSLDEIEGDPVKLDVRSGEVKVVRDSPRVVGAPGRR